MILYVYKIVKIFAYDTLNIEEVPDKVSNDFIKFTTRYAFIH
jgi:hypothetical protein